MLPLLLGAVGGPLLKGAIAGTALGSLSASTLGAGIAGLTSLAQGNDLGTAALDALGGYGGAGAISNLSNVGQMTSTAARNTAAATAGNQAALATPEITSFTDPLTGGLTGTTTSFPTDLSALTQPQLDAAGMAAGRTLANIPAAPTGLFDSTVAGFKDLMSPGGAQRFADITGSSALSSVGVPAAGLAISAMSPEPIGPYEEPSYGFAPFVPISERRRANMGYAGGGLADLNPMAGAFDARNTPQEYGEVIKNFAKGGTLNMENGGFVVPADVAGHFGNGSNEKGLAFLKKHLGARPIRGAGDGMSDDIPASIEGKQPARVADGEAYVPKAMVAKIGDGDVKRGARRLYAMMDKIRKARTGTAEQGREINPEKFLPA